MEKFDLLTAVEYGGCSAKISPDILENLLEGITVKAPLSFDISKLLVGFDKSDDAAIYKLNEKQAIIFTTDFFPPMCSDAYTFGQISAANAMSDVYAMGGSVLMALNLIMFPGEKIPLNVLSEILKGGQDKVCEAGAIIAGGHTIDDFPPKYGLAVVGLVHPDEIITNASVKPGDVLILTKKIGVGTIMTGNRVGLVEGLTYTEALENMKMLNKEAARLMNKYGVKAATDITGFGLLGHALKMASASSVCLEIDVNNVQFYPQAMELLEQGCIPGACFRNKNYSKKHQPNIFFGPDLSYSEIMLLHDPQTSGGMLIAVKEQNATALLQELKHTYPDSTIVGKVTEFKNFNLNIKK